MQNVRVIQRNLVYVVGLSMNLCREEVCSSPLRRGLPALHQI